MKGCRTGTLKKLVTKDILDKFNSTTAMKKLERYTTRSGLNDFDRFKVMTLRKQKAAAIRLASKGIKKASKKAAPAAAAKKGKKAKK